MPLLLFLLLAAGAAGAQTHGISFDRSFCECVGLQVDPDSITAMGTRLSCAYQWPVEGPDGSTSYSSASLKVSFIEDYRLEELPGLMEEARADVAAIQQLNLENECATAQTVLSDEADHYTVLGSGSWFGVIDDGVCTDRSPETCSTGRGILQLDERYLLQTALHTCIEPAGHDANVALMEQMEICGAEAAQDHLKRYRNASAPTPSPSPEGPSCHDWCLGLDLSGFWTGEGEHPNCVCDCGPDNLFRNEQCQRCSELCTGEGQSLFIREGQDCTCLCNDPLFKWDSGTGECVSLEGNEGSPGNGCQVDQGENCANSTDCSCLFVGDRNFALNANMRCQPSHPQADIRGCYLDNLSDQEILDAMRDEWHDCTNAWLAMNLAEIPDAGPGLEGMAGLPMVTEWLVHSGCLPSGSGREVTQSEASDPKICLMEYCRRVLGAGITEMENRINYPSPVVSGPGVRVRPLGPADTSPQEYVRTIGGNILQLTGAAEVHGDRPGNVTGPSFLLAVHSEYDLRFDPADGIQIHLLDGELDYYYRDGNRIATVTLGPGEKLVADSVGMPGEIQPFDAAELEDWWSALPYFVECPENAHAADGDCFCDAGFVAEPAAGLCRPSAPGEPAAPTSGGGETIEEPAGQHQAAETPAGSVDVPPEPDDDQTGIAGIVLPRAALIVGLVCFALLGLILVVVLVFFVRRRKQQE